MPRRRAAVIGSAKTVYRYADHLQEHCQGVDALAIEVLGFQVDDAAVEWVAATILAAESDHTTQHAATPGHHPSVLRLVITSTTTVRALAAVLDRKSARDTLRSTPSGWALASGIAVLVVGPATAAACRGCRWLSNVVFCGGRLVDVYEHLDCTAYAGSGEAGPPRARTLLLGVATGGDRSFRSIPNLKESIEVVHVYESAAVVGAIPAILAGLEWAGQGGGADLIVTSSKAASVLLAAVASWDECGPCSPSSSDSAVAADGVASAQQGGAAGVRGVRSGSDEEASWPSGVSVSGGGGGGFANFAAACRLGKVRIITLGLSTACTVLSHQPPESCGGGTTVLTEDCSLVVAAAPSIEAVASIVSAAGDAQAAGTCPASTALLAARRVAGSSGAAVGGCANSRCDAGCEVH